MHGSGDEPSKAFLRLHALGRPAIPLLIEVIDADSAYVSPYRNPILSHLPAGHFETRFGVRAAHLVELILARDTLFPLQDGDLTWGPLSANPENYVFPHGQIVRDTTFRGLSMAEMREVKALYETWWSANQSKSLAELRQDWRVGSRPLAGSPYEWR